MSLLASLVAFAGLATLPHARTTYRSARIPLEPFRLSAAQLRRDEKAGVGTGSRVDAINKAYSKALLSLMTRPHRTAYLEAVYRHVERFLAAHESVALEDVFVWGGAYAKRPASHA